MLCLAICFVCVCVWSRDAMHATCTTRCVRYVQMIEANSGQQSSTNGNFHMKRIQCEVKWIFCTQFASQSIWRENGRGRDSETWIWQQETFRGLDKIEMNYCSAVKWLILLCWQFSFHFCCGTKGAFALSSTGPMRLNTRQWLEWMKMKKKKQNVRVRCARVMINFRQYFVLSTLSARFMASIYKSDWFSHANTYIQRRNPIGHANTREIFEKTKRSMQCIRRTCSHVYPYPVNPSLYLGLALTEWLIISHRSISLGRPER